MSEKKEPVKVSMSTFFLIIAIIAIVIMAYFIYKLNNEKTTATEQVADLTSQVSSLESTVSNLQGKIDSVSETINSDSLSSSSQDTKISDDKIVLEGNYAYKESDVGYEFEKNGKVTWSGDVEWEEGTYVTTGKNEIKVTFTKSTVSDIDTGEEETRTINRVETIKIIDDKTLQVNNESEMLYKWPFDQ